MSEHRPVLTVVPDSEPITEPAPEEFPNVRPLFPGQTNHIIIEPDQPSSEMAKQVGLGAAELVFRGVGKVVEAINLIYSFHRRKP